MANFDSLITVKRNGELGARFEFSERPWASVGSHEDCDIRVHADGVAVLHALITLADCEPRIYGLDAECPVRIPERGIELRNSTFATLDSGDIFYCGERCFRFDKKVEASRRRRSSMRRRRKSMVVTDRGEQFVVPDKSGEVIAKERMTLPANQIAVALTEDLDLPPPASYNSDEVQPLAESNIKLNYSQSKKTPKKVTKKTCSIGSKKMPPAQSLTSVHASDKTTAINAETSAESGAESTIDTESLSNTPSSSPVNAGTSTKSAVKTSLSCEVADENSDSETDNGSSKDSDFSPSGEEEDEVEEENSTLAESKTPLRAGESTILAKPTVAFKTPLKSVDESQPKRTLPWKTPVKTPMKTVHELESSSSDPAINQSTVNVEGNGEILRPALSKTPGKPPKSAALAAKRNTELLQPAIKKQRLPPRTPGQLREGDSSSSSTASSSGSIRPPTKFANRRTPIAASFTTGPVATRKGPHAEVKSEKAGVAAPATPVKDGRFEPISASDFTPRRAPKRVEPPASAFTPRRHLAKPKNSETPAKVFTPRRNTNAEIRDSRTNEGGVPASVFTPRRLQPTPGRPSRTRESSVQGVPPPSSAFTPRRRAVLSVPDVDEYASRLPQLKSPGKASPPHKSSENSASKPVVNKLVAKTPGVAPPAVSPGPSPRSSGRTAKSTYKATVDGQENIPPRRLSRTRINQGVFTKSPLANASPKSSPWTHTSHEQRNGMENNDESTGPVTLTVTAMQPLVSPAKLGFVENEETNVRNEGTQDTPKEGISTSAPRKRSASMGTGVSTSRTPKASRRSAGPVKTIVKTPKGKTPTKARMVAFAEVHLSKGPHYSPAGRTPQRKLRYAGDSEQLSPDVDEVVPQDSPLQDAANAAPRVPGDAPAPLKNLGRFFFPSNSPENVEMDAQDEVSENDVASSAELQPKRKSLTERLSGLFGRNSPGDENSPSDRVHEEAEEKDTEGEVPLENIVEDQELEVQEPRRRSLIGAARYLASGVLSTIAASPARSLLGIEDEESGGESSEITTSPSEIESTGDSNLEVEVATHKSAGMSTPLSADAKTVTPVPQPMAVELEEQALQTPTNRNLLENFEEEAANQADTDFVSEDRVIKSPAHSEVHQLPVVNSLDSSRRTSMQGGMNEDAQMADDKCNVQETNISDGQSGSEKTISPQLDHMTRDFAPARKNNDELGGETGKPDSPGHQQSDDPDQEETELHSEPENIEGEVEKELDSDKETSEQEAPRPSSSPVVKKDVPKSEAELSEAEEPTDYSKWTVKELRQYLGGLDITIGKGMRKADLIKAAQEADGTSKEDEVEEPLEVMVELTEKKPENDVQVPDRVPENEENIDAPELRCEADGEELDESALSDLQGKDEVENEPVGQKRKEELKAKLGKKTVSYLRDLLDKLQLDSRGRKSELVDALANESVDVVEKLMAEADAPKVKKSSNRRTPARNAKAVPEPEVMVVSEDEVEVDNAADENVPPGREERESELKKLTVKKLQTLLGKLKLDKAGKKSDLVERILESEFAENSNKVEEEESPEPKSLKIVERGIEKPTTRSKRAKEKVDVKTPIDNIDLTKLTVAKLRKYLKQHNVDTSGLKAELLARATLVQNNELHGDN